MMQEWKDFNEGIWTECIDVEDFILKNYHEYKGDDSFRESIILSLDILIKKMK